MANIKAYSALVIFLAAEAVASVGLSQETTVGPPPRDESPIKGAARPHIAQPVTPRSPWWMNPPKLPPDPKRIGKIDELLRTIDRIERDERFLRWEAIFAMAEGDLAVAQHLRTIAMKPSMTKSRYARYVAAANVAGFGFPTRLGPNSIRANFNILSSYINLQKGFAVPSHKTRLLKVEPQIANLKIQVAPNKKEDLRFQEILWIIIEKYNLEFRTDPDGTFHIILAPPTI